MQSYNPGSARRPGLGSSLFARHYSGNHYYFLFLPVLRCFSSRGWLSLRSDYSSNSQVVPFGNLRMYRSCAAPRSLSQLTTSFIASQTLGIHHAPLFALKLLSVAVLHRTATSLLFLISLSQYVKELSFIPGLKPGAKNRRCPGSDPRGPSSQHLFHFLKNFLYFRTPLSLT